MADLLLPPSDEEMPGPFRGTERQPVADVRRRLQIRGRRLPALPAILLIPLFVFGLFGASLAPHDASDIDPANALRPPVWTAEGDWTNPLGTDHAGRDVLSRIMAGARNSLTVALVGVFLAGTVGVIFGLLAGFTKGVVDDILMRLVDIQLAVPAILLAILLAGALGRGIKPVIATVAVTFWSTYARVVRGETLSIMQRDYVALAEVAGASRMRILARHVFPNLVGTVVVLATLQLGAAVGLESALTFLGLGVTAPDTAWGLMIADGRAYMSKAWWITVFPGIVIMMSVLGANLLGDWLRDRLDPRLRQG